MANKGNDFLMCENMTLGSELKMPQKCHSEGGTGPSDACWGLECNPCTKRVFPVMTECNLLPDKYRMFVQYVYLQCLLHSYFILLGIN